MWFKNEDLNILVFHSARLKSFGPRDTSEEEAFSRTLDIGEQGEAKREAKNENEAGERQRIETEGWGEERGFYRRSPKCPNSCYIIISRLNLAGIVDSRFYLISN